MVASLGSAVGGTGGSIISVGDSNQVRAMLATEAYICIGYLVALFHLQVDK